MRRVAVLVSLGMVMSAPPAAAQGVQEPLFDTFNFKFEGSWVQVATTIRLDSEAFGKGTTLSFENDLGLPEQEIRTLALVRVAGGPPPPPRCPLAGRQPRLHDPGVDGDRVGR